MAKLTVPKMRYLAQDEDGYVYAYENMPKSEVELGIYLSDGATWDVTNGKPNPNWQESVIDLDADEHEFEDGILLRINK